MGTATALALQVARRLNDSAQSALNAAGYLDFLNMAIDDLAAAGWLQPVTDDTSLTLVQGTYKYTVPSGFAYVRHLHVADPNGDFPDSYEIPFIQWEIALNVVGAVDTPQFVFWPDKFDLMVNGRAIRVRGQKRPSGSLAGSATIVSGMEAFIRERAVAYAGEYLAGGVSELSKWRQVVASQSWAKSQAMLAYHPQEFRVRPSSRLVLGR